MRRLKPAALAAAFCCLLLAAPAAQAQRESGVLNPKRCDVSQLVLDTCPNLVTARFDNGRHQWSLSIAGPIALFEKLETYSREPVEVMIIEYPAFEKDQRRMLSASKAWFLYGAEGDSAVCQQPCIFAFRTKDDALAAQKELGGKLLQWEETAKQAREAAAEWNPHGKRKNLY